MVLQLSLFYLIPPSLPAMGRKFRLGIHRKNEERKCAERKRAMSMVVSVPLSMVSLPQEELLCSLPLSVFTHSSATCASSLHNRLCHSEALKGLPIATVLEVSVIIPLVLLQDGKMLGLMLKGLLSARYNAREKSTSTSVSSSRKTCHGS